MCVEQGQCIALLGANGSGKSTLLHLLDGLYFAASGSITAFWKPPAEDYFQRQKSAIVFRRRVGFVFQNPDVQLFNPTVFDEVAFGPPQLGWEKSAIRKRVAEMLDFMALADLKDRAPHRLSGGEKTRGAGLCAHHRP